MKHLWQYTFYNFVVIIKINWHTLSLYVYNHICNNLLISRTGRLFH